MAAPAETVETIRGSTLPRIWTPPLVTGPPGGCPCGCALTRETSYGFALIRFAEAIGWPFDPWQEFLAIHTGEWLPDGRPRFRKLLIIVARQNGKTIFSRVLILFWMFIQKVKLTVATHTDRGEAKKSWQALIDMAESIEWLKRELPTVHQKLQIGEEDFWNSHGAHYMFKAPNRRAGRGSTVHRALLDEIREHANRDAFAAVEGAMRAARGAQLVCIGNQGDRKAVVLRSLRDAAIKYIETGTGDPRVGLIEWSAPPDSDPTDLHALAQANPNLNQPTEYGIAADELLADAQTAAAEGGEALDLFKIEYMCIGVDSLKSAISGTVWRDRGPREDRPAIDLAKYRNRLAVCVDVSEDGKHATLSGAAMLDDGTVHVGIIAGWKSTATLRRELPGVIAKIRPRVLAWMPGGPAAAVLADLARPKVPLRDKEGRPVRWPPRGVKLHEITSEVPAVCMGFVEQIEADELRHDGHELGVAHAANAIKRARGEVWVFDRKGAGHVDALYSMAGAVHEARTLPKPRPAFEVVKGGKKDPDTPRRLSPDEKAKAANAARRASRTVTAQRK